MTEPEQEQRCYCGNIYRLGVVHREDSFCDEHPRKPLTDEEIAKAWSQSKGDIFMRLKPFARAIEAAHGIKE